MSPCSHPATRAQRRAAKPGADEPPVPPGLHPHTEQLGWRGHLGITQSDLPFTVKS